MPTSNKYSSEIDGGIDVIPFDSVQEAWFWFIKAQQARDDGARFLSGHGLLQRPCEPIDFLKILDRLYRNRRLLRDHLLVLRHYGRRQLPPDPNRVKEAHAYILWEQALKRLEPVLRSKKIIQEPLSRQHPNWMNIPESIQGRVSL